MKTELEIEDAIVATGTLTGLVKAALPFFSDALGGLLSGCSIYGTGIGATL